MSNSDNFLRAFNMIELFLRKSVRADQYTTFYQLVDKAKATNASIRSLELDLKEFADLRNAIIHERTDGHVIAEPNLASVRKIEQMAEIITKPPTVQKFMSSPVQTFKGSQSISVTVKFLYDKSFSQAPIYEGDRFAGLLTTNTISRWLGADVRHEIISLEEPTNLDVLRYTEYPEHVKFLKPEATVFDAVEVFSQAETSGKRLEAILVTNAGNSQSRLLGMITIWDLPKLHKAISLI